MSVKSVGALRGLSSHARRPAHRRSEAWGVSASRNGAGNDHTVRAAPSVGRLTLLPWAIQCGTDCRTARSSGAEGRGCRRAGARVAGSIVPPATEAPASYALWTCVTTCVWPEPHGSDAPCEDSLRALAGGVRRSSDDDTLAGAEPPTQVRPSPPCGSLPLHPLWLQIAVLE